MTFVDPNLLPLWQLLTRLGEAQILLPAALLVLLALLIRPGARPFALAWLLLLGTAALLTTASKVAFIGWGLGWPELDFTGISGHAMFSAAVYPVLLGMLAPGVPRWTRPIAMGTGCAIAILVGVSRVILGAHSISEVVAGLLLGGAVSAATLTLFNLPAGLISPAVPALVALWLGLMPVHAPASRTHAVVTRLSLALSGHDQPHTRTDMLRALHRRQETSCASGSCARETESVAWCPHQGAGDVACSRPA